MATTKGRYGYAGSYSRSYPKTTPPTWLRAQQATFRKDLREYIYADGTGRDILDRVEANSRNASGMVTPSLPGGPGGFSGKVSKGNRPKHKAGR